MIYLDNAATTLKKPDEVIENIIYGLKNIGNSGRGVNKLSLNTARIIYDTRVKLCEFFNGDNSKNIIFTSNATESLNTVINGLFEKGDHVITTELEHNSVLRPLYKLEKEGLELDIIKKDEILNIDDNILKKYIKTNTKAIICNHASNVTGEVINIKKIGQFTKENNILLIVDVSQSAGVIKIDVKENNIDILCFTGHKSLYGPQGTGGIYVRDNIKIKPLKVGGSGIKTFDKEHPSFMPECLEAGTLNGHGIIGLSAGIDFINKIGIENIYKKENELTMYFYEKIKNIKNIKIYGNFDKNIIRTPVVSMNIGDIDSGEICDILNEEYEIITRSGGHCAPLVHKALGTEEQGVVRFSFSYFTTKDEIDEAIKAIHEIVNQINDY